MKLDQYSATLNEYPELGSITPFRGWSRGKASQSLIWYEAHNLVKHNRELNLNKATLFNAINATVACYILMIAQYGIRYVKSDFYRVSHPKWKRQEQYILPEYPNKWASISLNI